MTLTDAASFGPEDDRYAEPRRPAMYELREKGSRFLAEVFSVDTPEDAAEKLAAVRKKAYDATHHCSAWRVDSDGGRSRFDDDGEPSGTAGPPILRQIEAHGVTNVLVVVTRWYGGTKLGKGGLIRAYGGAAAAALDEAGHVERFVTSGVRVRFAYDDTSPAMHTIGRFETEITGTAYGTDTAIDLRILRSQVEPFEAAWINALGGRGAVVRLDE